MLLIYSTTNQFSPLVFIPLCVSYVSFSKVWADRTDFGKVHTFWEGHKILQNIHRRTNLWEDFAKFCGLLRLYELYQYKLLQFCQINLYFWEWSFHVFIAKISTKSEFLHKKKFKIGFNRRCENNGILVTECFFNLFLDVSQI